MSNEELYHKVVSEVLFSRAVTAFIAAFVVFAVISDRGVAAFFGFYAVLCLIKSCVEYTKGC